MKEPFLGLIILVTFLLPACSPISSPHLPAATSSSLLPDEDRSGCAVTEPPLELRLDGFYAKYCSAQGIPIVASEEVADLALQQAYYIINNMLAPIPGTRNVLAADGHYVGIIGKNQQQTTLPEYSQMDSDYWDQRARGLGAGWGVLITSSAEENLLCLGRVSDRYYGESILVHEFAHTIHLSGQGAGFREFNEELSSLYYAARENGLWQDTYAMTNPEEYWAEGIQTYFSTNIGKPRADGVHNPVNTREELAEYDPELFEFIADFYQDFSWTPTCPE